MFKVVMGQFDVALEVLADQVLIGIVIAESGDKVLASASTLEAEVRKSIKNGGNIAAAAEIGKRIAEKAKAAGVTTVAFDRSGYKYHGRIKALADAARENGLSF